jgi:hypothetical protein
VADVSNKTNTYANKTELNDTKTDLKKDFVKTADSEIKKSKKELKEEILASVTKSLKEVNDQTNKKMEDMMNTLSANVNKSASTSTKTMSDASLNLMFAQYELKLNNLSSQVKSAMDLATKNAPDPDWATNKPKLLKWTNIDDEKVTALTNLNIGNLSGWANSGKTYTELQDTLTNLSGKISGYNASMSTTLTDVNNMKTTLLGLPNASWVTNLATKTELNSRINGLNASYIPLTDAKNYVATTWANQNLATKTDLSTAISGLNTTYLPRIDANKYVATDWVTQNLATKSDLSNAIKNAGYIPIAEQTNLAKKTDLTNAISSLNASYVPRSETNNFAKFDSNNNLSVPGNLLVGNANKWKLDPLPGSLQVTKQ